MKNKSDIIYQIKIRLKNIRPPIWRRILVPKTYSFQELHTAIQDAMGWDDYHLPEFRVGGVRIEGKGNGLCVDSMWKSYNPNVMTVSATGVKLNEFIKKEKQKFNYIYDFGDQWEHAVVLEKILPAKEGVVYPVCIGGKRACPPEDCGGPCGYEDFLCTISDPENPGYKERMEWAGGEFDPEHFDAKEIRFRNPVKITHNNSGARITKLREQKVRRNDMCPCGSGKKYKKCCMNK
jgi:hypothetical protein